jgi:hypothetical protein
MKFSKLLLLTSAFCATILLALFNTQKKVNRSAIESIVSPDGPDEFIKFHKSIRTPEGEERPAYKPGFLVSELRKLGARTQSNGVLEWKERGPANVPGRTRGLLVDPADPNKNTWFACSVGGGVWKTTNAGTSWTLITPELSNLATTVIAMATSNPNVIYVGTGEGFGNLDGISGNGMFKSTDKGQNWAYLPSTSNFDDINRAIIDPTNENIVVVASNSGIYKTTDGGTNWTKVSTRTGIQDLKATPGNFTIQYATQNGIGVIKSVDSGATWALANIGMGVLSRIEIAIAPTNPSRIYASCENGDSPKMLVSDDAATSWSLIDIRLTTTPLDFLGGTQANDGQGWYDNALAVDPFDASVIYVGGIDLFRIKLDGGSTNSDIYTTEETGTSGFLSLTNFNGSNGTFDVGTSANKTSVEIRFGPDKSQKAHRFLTPVGAGSGVAAANYSYTDYVTVPFEVWDVTNNKQLMASFRDQGRNGTFELINSNTTATDASLQSREYIFVNNIAYDGTAPNSSIAVNGGHVFNQMFFIWPVLPDGGVWPPTTNGTLKFKYGTQLKLNATTTFITDARGQYGNPNKNSIVHPDHHNIVMIPMSASTYKILNANDGGVFISNTSSTPGINDGDWTFAGSTYNTSQFYGADKRPGFDEYLGGMQDNGTWKSPPSAAASKTTLYSFNIGGDGFEVLWNNYNDKKLIGGSQGNGFRRSIDGGTTWSAATSGLSGNHPFISKLANSRNNPETIYTLSSAGVFRSINFGESWALTPITDKWGAAASLMDVEVSRANANIVWAGSGMVNTGTLRNLHVSTNSGTSFNPTNNYTDVTLGGISKLASHPTEQNTAYALFSFAGKPKILKTTNLGQNWNDISGFNTGSTSTNGFPDVAVYCLYVRPDDPNIIWAGTEIGIVESLDNGQTWAILEDFPNVSVWDMKGLDDQIIIATHGRGIWTAKISNLQESNIKKPNVLAVGTSPQSDFVFKFLVQDSFDSTQVFLNTQKVGKISQLTAGEYVVKIKNVTPGNIDIKLVGFKNTAPYHSSVFSGKHIPLIKSFQKQYANLFVNTDDFLTLNTSFILADFGTSNQSLQSTHNYPANFESSTMLLQPIIVTATNSSFFYQDVALIQPSAAGVTFGQPAFKDYVVVEGTKDGLTWIPLKDGYNASANANWLAAHNVGQTGVPSLSVDQNIDIKSKFSANDTLLFRFRLKSDADAITGWGWSIDNLFIQQTPTGIEQEMPIADFTIYPNPTSGKVKVQYVLKESSSVNIETNDVNGKSVSSTALGIVPSGKHEVEIDLTTESTGIYFVKLKTNNGERIGKILVRK